MISSDHRPPVIAAGGGQRSRTPRPLRSRLAEARAGTGRLVLCVGEPGIGKTRLAQELAGAALADGVPVAWGRCAETAGAPPYWPWRQVLRSLRLDPDTPPAGDVASPDDRFRVFDTVAEALSGVAAPSAACSWCSTTCTGPASPRCSCCATSPTGSSRRRCCSSRRSATSNRTARCRACSPTCSAPRPWSGSPRAGFGLVEVAAQLGAAGVDEGRVHAVLDATGGNPLFVREVARAIADGTWRADRAPRTVLDLVGPRVDRLTPDCRAFLRAAAIVGGHVTLTVVAAAVGDPVAECLPRVDEAMAFGRHWRGCSVRSPPVSPRRRRC